MGFSITATHLNYYHICKHKLWLFANGISMEHTSGLVAEGKVLHNTAYAQRPKKYREIQLGGSKIDFYDPKKKVIHEIKRSDAMHAVDAWQIKFYIWLLEDSGVLGTTGIIEYPYLREKRKVILEEKDKIYIKNIIQKTKTIISQRSAPRRVRKKICDRCAYFDFCWVNQ
jgi:CRISPR-associated exonuclease Cas4